MSTAADQPLPTDHLLTGGKTDHLTDAMAQSVVDFMVDFIGRLGLPMWQVMVMVEPAPDDCWADIEHMEGKLVAQLRLCKGWMGLEHSIQGVTLVHETLHLLHYRIDQVIDDLHQTAGVDAAMRTRRQYNREIEYMVEHLSRVFGQLIDLEALWVKILKKNKAYKTS